MINNLKKRKKTKASPGSPVTMVFTCKFSFQDLRAKGNTKDEMGVHNLYYLNNKYKMLRH